MSGVTDVVVRLDVADLEPAAREGLEQAQQRPAVPSGRMTMRFPTVRRVRSRSKNFSTFCRSRSFQMVWIISRTVLTSAWWSSGRGPESPTAIGSAGAASVQEP
ncbi:hypothetical protein [Plantibacter sp. M259]|uniref:hypothetical protein n=1 Tax=Plantibacter sp. M259 TaxID=2583822 RepID=UPI001F0F1523|nr:hypothetical protein [Plantibacter sp. M259]